MRTRTGTPSHMHTQKHAFRRNPRSKKSKYEFDESLGMDARTHRKPTGCSLAKTRERERERESQTDRQTDGDINEEGGEEERDFQTTTVSQMRTLAQALPRDA